MYKITVFKEEEVVRTKTMETRPSHQDKMDVLEDAGGDKNNMKEYSVIVQKVKVE